MHHSLLPNGLAVIIVPVKNRVVALDIWFDVGSRDEQPQDFGMAHFLEHMMFKGTPKYGPNELDLVITSAGGSWNAGTSKDFTHYYINIGAPYFDTALEVLSEMVQRPVIDVEEFNRERQVIQEEYRRKQDDPWGVLFDDLYETFYAEGPYKHEVLGSFETITNMDRDRMVEFYRKNYTPANAALMVVGDIAVEDVLPKIEAAFSEWSGEKPARTSDEHTCAMGIVREIKRPVEETYIGMAWPAAEIAAEDVYAIELAAMILGDGRSSRLHQHLHEKKQLFSHVAGQVITKRGPSFFCVGGTLNDASQQDEALSQASQCVRMFSNDGPSEEELERVKTKLSSSFLFTTEKNTGRSGQIGFYYTAAGDLDMFTKYVERCQSLTAEDVRRAAERYLTNEPCIVIVKPELPVQEDSSNS